MDFETVKWVGGVDGFLELIDQRRLPGEYTKIQCHSLEDVWQAIKTLAVRGAPAIGVTAAYGAVIGLQAATGVTLAEALKHMEKCCDHLATSRPTAVNLFWAIERVKKTAVDFAKGEDADTTGLTQAVLTEAHRIRDEDIEMCRKIGINGARFIKDRSGVLTHCNAGALATAGQGTALSIMFEAKKAGTKFTAYVDETRPLLQGARLTAWELKRAGIDTVLLCDNMAGALMQAGKVDAVITGADRIAANGDTANKIGTYTLSVLAREHNIHFYIAAPSSTFDLHIESGDRIPIEQRDANEVRGFLDLRTTPQDVDVYNPAFDVTPARYISAIITEKGVIENPNTEKIRKHLG